MGKTLGTGGKPPPQGGDGSTRSGEAAGEAAEAEEGLEGGGLTEVGDRGRQGPLFLTFATGTGRGARPALSESLPGGVPRAE